MNFCGLVPSGNKPLPEPMLTLIYGATRPHWVEHEVCTKFVMKNIFSTSQKSVRSVAFVIHLGDEKNSNFNWALGLNSLRLRQNRRHFAEDIFKFNLLKENEFWLRFHWSLFLRVPLTIFQHCLVPTRRQAIIGTGTNDVYWCIHASPGLNELFVDGILICKFHMVTTKEV